MEVTDEKIGDGKVLVPLVEEAQGRCGWTRSSGSMFGGGEEAVWVGEVVGRAGELEVGGSGLP